MTNSRLPDSQPNFDIYIWNVDNHLNGCPSGSVIKRGITLGLTIGNLEDLNARRLAWRSGDDANPGIYEIHIKSETKNKLSSTNVVNFMKAFGVFFRPLLDIIAANPNITSQDRIVLNIAEPVTTHHIPTTPISQQCFPTVIPLGGGRLDMACRSAEDASRPSKPENCTGVEISYRIDAVPAEGTDPKQLKSADDGTTKIIKTKAKFELDFGEENCGKNVTYYVHWININHPNLNGPQTGPFSNFIS